MRTTTNIVMGMMAVLIIAAGVGAAIGLYLSLPPICLTMANWERYTPECREAMLRDQFPGRGR